MKLSYLGDMLSFPDVHSGPVHCMTWSDVPVNCDVLLM
jgi:hypothetical protein